MGGLLETSLRWPRICTPISGPLHPPCGYLQSSPGFLCRWPGNLSLARFGPQQRTETYGFIARQILAPLPVARAPQRLRAHSAFRLPGQPPACHAPTALLSPSRLRPRAASRSTRCFHGRCTCSLALSEVWWPNEGRRTAYGGPNPTPLSASGRHCSMKSLSPIRILHAPRHGPHSCAFPPDSFFLSAPSATFFARLCHRKRLLSPPRPWCPGFY